jgi:hypothetical protein
MNSSLARPLSARNERTFLSVASLALAALAIVPGCAENSKGGSSFCNTLANAASESFATFVDEHTTCAQDSDCTQVHLTESGFCASPCPVVMNQAGAASAGTASSQDCARFNAEGCSPPFAGCPGFGSPICATGVCALYSLDLSESGAFVHGACTSLTETYEQYWAATPAPRAFALTVTATGGTLYADAACTTPLSSSTITLSAGSTSTTFGFIPAAAAPFSITISNGSASPGGLSGDAQ